jgi:hypothetical protein
MWKKTTHKENYTFSLKFEILNFIPRKQIHGKGCQEQIRSEYVNEEL